MQIDAGKAHTEGGWRDMRVATFAVREPARPCTSEDYDRRDLPKPSARLAIAGIETAESFGPRCEAEAERPDLPDVKKLTVPGDGAGWIWDLSEAHLAGAEQMSDVYHATKYLADLARAGFDGDTEAAEAWRRRARLALVADGWAGVCEFVHENKAETSKPWALEAAYPQVASYL